MKNIAIFFFALLTITWTSCSTHVNGCFSYAPSTPSTTIVFNSSCSSNLSYYNWSFGDGTPDTLTTSNTVTHKYATKGTYKVTLSGSVKDGEVTGDPNATEVVTVQ